MGRRKSSDDYQTPIRRRPPVPRPVDPRTPPPLRGAGRFARGSADKTFRSIADAFEQTGDLRFEIFALQIAGEANCILANRIGAEPRQLFGFARANLHDVRNAFGWGLERYGLTVSRDFRDFHAQTFHEALDLRPQIFARQRARK